MNSIDTIARHVIQTRFEDLPEDAVAATCKFILDTLVVPYRSGCVVGFLVKKC